MKFVLALMVSFFLAACRGPEVPSVFPPESPAAPTTTPASRQTVADVLGASNPLDAEGGAKSTLAPPSAPTSEPEHHHHHHHHH